MDFKKITESPRKVVVNSPKRKRDDSISTKSMMYFDFEKSLTDENNCT